MNIKQYMSYADIVSLGNASFGFLSIIMVLNGYLALAAQFMLIAVIFDSLDGWVARRTKRVDEFGFGENIDSLSDVILLVLHRECFCIQHAHRLAYHTLI